MMFFDDFVLILSERLLPLAQHWERGLGGEGPRIGRRLLPLAQHWERGLGGEGPCLRVGTERKA